MRARLRASLRGIIVIAFLAPNLVDQGFLWALALLSSVSLIWSSLPVYTVMRAVRDRVYTAKISELARLNAALRGDTRLLDGSLLARRASELRVVDLLAYREFVAAVPEWAFDNLARARLTLYLLLPLGSWLGGALVERALSALLGGD